MEKILVSACLFGGGPYRYDGQDKTLDNPTFNFLKKMGILVPICPEIAGGLSVPREPAELVEGKAKTEDGTDVTDSYMAGAMKALEIIENQNIKIAILKDGSPSCGVHNIYDGNFSGKKIDGKGLTAKLLEEFGVLVYSEDEIEEAAEMSETLYAEFSSPY
jgi:uncharacterized protein YbbK (DUF523 family)